MNEKNLRRAKRHLSIRSRVQGSKERPRLVVFRSSQHIYGMLVDDKVGKTILAVSDKEMKKTGTKTEKASEVGKSLAEKAKNVKIKKVVFDRAGYLYHGRVKALAEAARVGGLEF